MHIDHEFPEKQDFWLLKLIQDDTQNQELEPRKLEPNGYIEANNLKLTFINNDK